MMAIIKKILCPYDGTTSGDNAFKTILGIARVLGAEIVVITCIKDRAALGFFKLKSDERKMKKQIKNTERKFTQLKKQAEVLGISIKSKIIRCDIVSKEIVNYAKKENIDIIAMSKTKNVSEADKMYNDNTVEMIFKESPCSFIHLK